MKIRIITFAASLLFCFTAFAQNARISVSLVEKGTGDPVGFATVSLTPKGASKATKYALTSDDGKAVIEAVRKGNYTIKAELLGYKAYTKELTVTGEDINLGKVEMLTDREQLEAAKVSAVGNSIIIKKDTIEYNATSFKTTENDVLEDLLKKLPGVEVAEDGGITINGETIKKITIDGKTFFLDDPQLASKNIPAKIVNKLKVIEKKSEQAEFTGIDDGETETVIDLSIKPGMMKGAFGSISAGVGHDIPTSSEVEGDWRYQGAGFIGNFTDKQQLSIILNGNNTNNRGFNDLQGSMMGNMRGGGGGRGRGQGGWGNGNGITTSYMGGVNGAWDLFDKKMDLAGNYLYNYTDKEVEENSIKTAYRTDGDNLVYKSGGENGGPALNSTISGGHRFGIRVDHEFNENTSILFEPRINFGTGSYTENSVDTTFNGSIDGPVLNSAYTRNSGQNKNVSTSGFLLLRQRLGAPGRTLTLMGRYSFSNNDLDGENSNGTRIYDEDGVTVLSDSTVLQSYKSNSRNTTLFTRATFTQPIGKDFYVEANYAFNYARSASDKETFDLMNGGIQDYTFSNSITNTSKTHEMGANLMYQNGKIRAQLGLTVMPNITENETTRYDSENKRYEPMVYDSGLRWNWAPRAMVWGSVNDSFNFRMFYRGQTRQPSTSQLMPVPDNADPLNVNFGNPTLLPYFSHSMNGDIRYNNKAKFSSFNVRFNATYNDNPVVNTIWYRGGAQYSMPFNSDIPSITAGISGFLNTPVGKSDFTICDMTRIDWSQSSSYVGTDIDMSTYDNDGYYAFMNELTDNFQDKSFFDSHITSNRTRTLTLVERFRVIYRLDNLEIQASARTRYNQSWYTLASEKDKTATFNNQIRLGANWTQERIGLTIKPEFNFNWYNGYTTPQKNEYVLNLDIQKSLFKKKFTLSLKGYDLLGQAKNLTITDDANYHQEALNNTLGRYAVLSLTYRFGNFDKSKMRGGYQGPRR